MEKLDNNNEFNKLNIIRQQIENMSKYNQVEILRILTKNKNTVINENNYGIHINLTELDGHIIDELNKYIAYVALQEQYLNNDEQEKEKYKSFLSDN
jgi:hypothetical protein